VQASLRARTVSALAATLVVTGAVIALVLGLSYMPVPSGSEGALTAILPARSSPPTPPPSPTPSPEPQRINEGAPPDDPAPAGARAEAAQIVLPSPKMPPLISPPPVLVSRVTGVGSDPTQGQARSVGTGTGAGGTGTGDGGGGNGGHGNVSGRRDYSAYPRQTAGKLHYYEIPRELRRDHGGVIRLRYTIGIDGRVSDCSVIQSSGLPDFDRATCARITARFRFRPARDLEGRPTPFVMTETHGWDYEPGP
jgi:TonB family C-terminal domain